MNPRLEFTVRNLVKLAKAADPWSSCLAVYFNDKGNFYIWGLIDQTVHFNTLLMREREGGYSQPGLFHVQATGAADLTVYREWGFVARLAQDNLIRRQNRVFWTGPVSARLGVGIEKFLSRVLRGTEYRSYGDAPVDAAFLADRWIGTLCRVLISIQKYRHGGALLLTRSNADLDIKYPIKYPRLSEALLSWGIAKLTHSKTQREIFDDYLEKKKEFVPAELYLENSISADAVEDLDDEITGCVRFISSMSCVDGLILASPDLEIRGFGVEIRPKKDVDAIYLASGPEAKVGSLSFIHPSHYGTRHRSMMRFCMAHPGTIGFVISQDGDIRALTRVGQRLIMWEDLEVHSIHEYTRKRSRSRAVTFPPLDHPWMRYR
jgi:hypothetical protein